MTPAFTLWLAFVLAVGFVAWFGTRKQAVAFLFVSIATAFAAPITLGHPSSSAPPAGQHTVLGARIDVDKAIYVLLDGPEPRYYVLRYSQQSANQLQEAMDGTADGQGSVGMTMNGDGSPGFAEVAPPPEPEKVGERAIIGG